MAQIKQMQCKRKPTRNRRIATTAATRAAGANTRQVPFIPGSSYRLIRQGIALDQHPEDVFTAGALTEAHLWHFRHVDDAAMRSGDKATTRYAAALQWQGAYIRPQHKYLQMCYRERKRAANDALLEDGTPWWTDVYLVNQCEASRAKERYKLAKTHKAN